MQDELAEVRKGLVGHLSDSYEDVVMRAIGQRQPSSFIDHHLVDRALKQRDIQMAAGVYVQGDVSRHASWLAFCHRVEK